jgi:hypothetical protein
MNGFRAAMWAALNGDASLTRLLATTSSIYHRRAPLAAGFPFILFAKQSGAPSWSFKGPPLDSEVWIVQGIDRAPSAATAEDISTQIDTVLTDPNLTLSDGTLMYCRRQSDVDFEEGSDPDALIHHVGGLYQVFIDRA